MSKEHFRYVAEISEFTEQTIFEVLLQPAFFNSMIHERMKFYGAKPLRDVRIQTLLAGLAKMQHVPPKGQAPIKITELAPYLEGHVTEVNS